jgi:hypothetical protein
MSDGGGSSPDWKRVVAIGALSFVGVVVAVMAYDWTGDAGGARRNGKEVLREEGQRQEKEQQQQEKQEEEKQQQEKQEEEEEDNDLPAFDRTECEQAEEEEHNDEHTFDTTAKVANIAVAKESSVKLAPGADKADGGSASPPDKTERDENPVLSVMRVLREAEVDLAGEGELKKLEVTFHLRQILTSSHLLPIPILHLAAATGLSKVIAVLCTSCRLRPTDVNDTEPVKQRSALHLAVANGVHTDVVVALLEGGVEVDMKDAEGEHTHAYTLKHTHTHTHTLEHTHTHT